MLRLQREEIRRFRTLLRRCRVRTSMNDVTVRVVAANGTLQFIGAMPDLTLSVTRKHDAGEADWCLPGDFLDLVETANADAVELHATFQSPVRCRWQADGRDCERVLELVQANVPALPDSPERWSDADSSILNALHEASQTADRAPVRYATHRIQLHGSTGRIVATDTRQAILLDGFRFPFTETLLIAASPVFGAKEWRNESVRIGRTADRVVLAIGSWRLALHIDATGKFPEVASIVPKSFAPTAVQFDEREARWILARLAHWPQSDPDGGITLDTTGDRVVLRCRGETDDRPTEVPLPASRASGPPIRFVYDRKHLKRALALGFRTHQMCGAEKPIVMRDRNRTYLAAGMHPSAAVPPDDEAHTIAPDGRIDGCSRRTRQPLPPLLEKIMPPAPNPIPRIASDTIASDTNDPLVEAEAIRNLLSEAMQRAQQLVLVLKAKRKTDRAITQVVRSIQALPLNGRS